MATGEAAEALSRRGLRAMDPSRALAALDEALDTGVVSMTVADVDWDRFAPVFMMGRPSRLLSELSEARQALEDCERRPDASDAGNELAERLAGLPATEHRRVLLDLVRAKVAVVLGHSSAAAVGPDKPFRDLGFDSLAAIELRSRLAAATGLSLPATLIFDCPTPDALADHLLQEIGGRDSDGGSVLTQIDLLRGALSAVDGDAAERRRVAARLESVLREFRDHQGPAPEVSTEDIEAASDDEIFDLIDRQLGLDLN